MKNKKTLKTILIWLPSAIISLFYLQIAFSKIILPSFFLVLVGILLLMSTILFLFNKTIIVGTTFLAFYITCIVFINLFHGKPLDVSILILVATIFSAYIRMPQLFIQKYDTDN